MVAHNPASRPTANGRSTWRCCGAPVVDPTYHPKCAPGFAPPPSMPTKAGVVGAAKGRSHFNAKNTTCLLGHAHPSKVEARVCARLHHERADGDVIYRNVRLALFALPPTTRGIAMYLNVDFVVTRDRRMVRIIDAKSGRRSRDWARGAAACEATYGLKVEEMS